MLAYLTNLSTLCFNLKGIISYVWDTSIFFFEIFNQKIVDFISLKFFMFRIKDTRISSWQICQFCVMVIYEKLEYVYASLLPNLPFVKCSGNVALSFRWMVTSVFCRQLLLFFRPKFSHDNWVWNIGNECFGSEYIQTLLLSQTKQGCQNAMTRCEENECKSVSLDTSLDTLVPCLISKCLTLQGQEQRRSVTEGSASFGIPLPKTWTIHFWFHLWN